MSARLFWLSEIVNPLGEVNVSQKGFLGHPPIQRRAFMVHDSVMSLIWMWNPLWGILSSSYWKESIYMYHHDCRVKLQMLQDAWFGYHYKTWSLPSRKYNECYTLGMAYRLIFTDFRYLHSADIRYPISNIRYLISVISQPISDILPQPISDILPIFRP